MGKFIFVGMLYVLGGCALAVGGHALFEEIRFARSAQSAVMKSSDPNVARTAKFAPNDSMRADVVYVTANGEIPVRDHYLVAGDVQRLARREGIAIRFREADPHYTLHENEQMPGVLGWMIAGVLVLALAVVAHRLLRQEMRVG
ncbi:MAG: hypothetical protein Q8O67_20935 [Deltaproteobacteria bacterium]|nr:hypothetical protein [Deltaproteobacteria bacterium]